MQNKRFNEENNYLNFSSHQKFSTIGDFNDYVKAVYTVATAERFTPRVFLLPKDGVGSHQIRKFIKDIFGGLVRVEVKREGILLIATTNNSYIWRDDGWESTDSTFFDLVVEAFLIRGKLTLDSDKPSKGD